MTREQMSAWLTIEGWELRRKANTFSPTFVNIGQGVWFTHWRCTVAPLSEYPSGMGSLELAPQGQWEDLNSTYLDQFIAAVITQGDQK